MWRLIASMACSWIDPEFPVDSTDLSSMMCMTRAAIAPTRRARANPAEVPARRRASAMARCRSTPNFSGCTAQEK